MGFLIFAARKLNLKRQINQKSYRQMCLSNQQQRVQAQIQELEQIKSTAQDAWNLMTNSIYSVASNIYSTSIQGIDSDLTKTSSIWQTAMKTSGSDSAEAIDAKNSYDQAVQEANSSKNDAFVVYQTAQAAKVMANQAFNSVLEASDDAQLEILHQKDKRYELEQSSLESSLTMLSAELSNVEKAEGKAAESTAPSFGQS